MWDITFERITYDSAEDGEAEDGGYLHEGLTFREAMNELRYHLDSNIEADSYPVSLACPPRWFTFYDVEKDYETGDTTHYALHIPPHITPASRLRVARLLGCYGTER